MAIYHCLLFRGRNRKPAANYIITHNSIYLLNRYNSVQVQAGTRQTTILSTIQ